MKHTQFLRVLFALGIVCIFTSAVSAHYRPALGRWVERDAVGYIDSCNIFEYVSAQPIGFLDPTGAAKYAPPGRFPVKPRIHPGPPSFIPGRRLDPLRIPDRENPFIAPFDAPPLPRLIETWEERFWRICNENHSWLECASIATCAQIARLYAQGLFGPPNANAMQHCIWGCCTSKILQNPVAADALLRQYEPLRDPTCDSAKDIWNNWQGARCALTSSNCFSCCSARLAAGSLAVSVFDCRLCGLRGCFCWWKLLPF